MRKKVTSVVLALGMGTLLLAGCQNPISVKENKNAVQEQSSPSEETTTDSEEEPKTDTDKEEITDAETTESDTNEAEDIVDAEATESDAEEDVDSEVTSDEDKNAGSPDIAPVEASIENPAKIGEWVEAKKRATQDKDYHTIYFRLTKVITGDEAKKIVDEYNSRSSIVEISDLEQEDLEYRIVTYEVYYPEDFPMSDYGIAAVSLDLNLCNLKDSGSIAGYIGLSSVWDISNESDALHAGETFKEGKAVFAMVKGSSEYLFKYGYKDKEEDPARTYVYVEGQ